MDRDLKLRPQMDQSSEMIFVRVRQHQAYNIAALLDQIADIGENELNAGEIIASEGNAEIDRKPPPVLLLAESVKREIHADLADPAERRENELIRVARHARVPVSQPGHFRSSLPPGMTRDPRPTWSGLKNRLGWFSTENATNSRS
jgi:hypothetical protein